MILRWLVTMNKQFYLDGGLVGVGVGAALEKQRVDPREVRPLQLMVQLLNPLANIYEKKIHFWSLKLKCTEWGLTFY